MTERGSRTSLAGNLTLLLLLVVGISVTVVSTFALAGVFDLARDEATARQSAYLQAASDQMDVRLGSAVEVLGRVIGVVIDSPIEEGVNRRALVVQVNAGAEYIDRLLLTDPTGRVISTYPSFRPSASIAREFLKNGPPAQGPRFVYTEDRELWVGRMADGPEGPTLVAVRVRTGWIESLLNGFATSGSGRWLAIVDSGGGLVATSSVGPLVDQDSVVYEPGEQRGAGSVSAIAEDGTMLSGGYAPVAQYPGLGWRVVFAEPRSTVIKATIRALTPAVIALFVSSVSSLVLGMVFVRRLVAPIKDLESHARAAVRGGFVESIHSDRTDELGSLAEAFNAVALRLNSLRDLSKLLASSRNLDQVLGGILSAVGHIVGSTRVAVYLLDEEARVLRLVACQGFDRCDAQVELEKRTWLSDALKADKPIEFIADEATVIGLGLEPDVVLSGLACPLRVGEHELGLVAVFDTGRRHFTEAEQEMMRTFSEQAAVAVRNSRLFALEAAARRQAETLRAAAEALVRPVGLEQALQDVVALARDILGVDWAGFAIVDRMDLGIAPATDVAGERAMLRAWGRTLVEGEPRSTTVVRRGDDPAIDAFLEEQGGSAVLFATAFRGAVPGAVLAFVVSDPNRDFRDAERELAEGFATQVSLALDNAYNYESARARAMNLETIFRISQAVSSSLQVKVVLNRVLDVVQKIFSADAVSLMTLEEDGRSITTAMARGLVSKEMIQFKCAPGEDLPGSVFSSGHPMRIDDLRSMSGTFAKLAVRQSMHSAVAVPMLARGRSLGVLTVFATDVGLYTDEDMELLHTFASQAALALDTAAMYSKEHAVASVLQDSILPETLPEFEEVETSSVYLPAGAEAEIGGDYYDVFRTPDGAVMLAMGDVCGKGVEAATKTSMIKYSVRGLAAAGMGPARILAEVNRMVAEAGSPSDIVTLWVGVLDVREGFLSYANGGHPSALLYHPATGEVDRLSPTGPLLGAVVTAPYEESRVRIEPGDVLLLYTDGVTEARRGNKFFGEGRVHRALSYGGRAADVTKRLLAALGRFVPGELRDDAAMLALRVKDVKREQTETKAHG